MQFSIRDPDTAYVTNNLLLPKRHIPVPAIKTSLEFVVGEEPLIDEETNEFLMSVPRTLRLWDENEHHLIVPKNYIPPEVYRKYHFPFVVESYDFDTVPIISKSTPRDAIQERALQALLARPNGTLNLACGRGKTVIGLLLAAEIQVPTLVVVNSKNLISQWKDEIGQHLDVSGVGVIQGDRMDWQHPIVIATIQTLAAHREKYPIEFRKRFGLVLYDEGHHMSAPVFVKAADLFFGRRYALTATARRTDGLEAIYQYHLGRVIFRDLSQELIPKTVFHVLDWPLPEQDGPQIRDVTGNVHMMKLCVYLGTLPWRNGLIERQIRKDLEADRKLLVLSHSKEHVYELARRFGTGNAITGDVADENERFDILRNRNPVFGTFQLAREALNKKELDTLYITTPFGNSNDLQQAWGRIQRVSPGKLQPLVRVFEDKRISNCTRACRGLRKYLKVLNYPSEKQETATGG